MTNMSEIYPANRGNAITEEYYNFLKGELNRKTIKNKSVCKIEHRGGRISHHLNSDFGGLQ